MKNICKITILPLNKTFEAYEGDSLYTLLLVAGLIDDDKPGYDRLRLEKGSISPAEHPEAEAAVFSRSELEEDWLLASERRITGDAVLTLPAEEMIPGGHQEPVADGWGLAVDMGTANICVGLIELDDLHIPLVTNVRNSQSDLGKDVNERLAYCRQQEGNLREMSCLLKKDIDLATDKLCRKAGICGKNIKAVTVVGNYPLTAIFLEQLPPQGWPPLCQVLHSTAGEVGLQELAGNVPLYLLPAASPNLGSDTIGAVLAANMLSKKDEPGVTILIDLGMRGELIAAGHGRLLATSVPALPFEGAGLSCGMSARTGAITGVTLNDKVVLRTVRDARPQGICGAGIISVVDQLLRRGMLNGEGRLLQPEDLPEELASRFRATMSGWEFILSYADKNCPHDICINQDDIHQVQLAKGAIYAACKAMLAALGADEAELNEILLAEASTATIRPAEALSIGLLPELEPEHVISIGNAAWQGAYIALTNQSYLGAAETLAKTLESLDLTSDRIYAEEFIKAMNFTVPADIF